MRTIGGVLCALLLAACGGGGTVAPTATGGPTLTEVLPTSGSVAGGTILTLRGSGFLDGAPEVWIGGVRATGPVVADDTTLSVTAPAGSGIADVEVRTDEGIARLADAYFYDATPRILYAADGKGGTAGQLYRIEPLTADATPIGAIGYAITGLARSPSGLLYGTESTRQNATHDSRLILIDTLTGAGTVVGPLLDSGGAFNHGAVADITYAGTRLIGWSESGDVPVEIDPSTGTVTILGGSVSSRGDGLAAQGPTALHFAPETSNGSLYVLNPETGITLPSVALTGGPATPAVIGALAWLDGVLYGVANNNQGPSAPRSSDLITIDPITGAIATIGALPPGVDALVGN
ncbi:MAG: IPT/TIG domain-containing protein [Planctomycetota bacterium]